MTAQQSPKVAILLCTYQGQQYLHEQLNSFVSQTHKNWELWVSDDGSKDGTHVILAEAVKDWAPGKISVHNGPQEGFCANFLSLTCHVDIKADYYAYSDQDDIWKSEKLARAVAALKTVPPGVPALYCSRTRVVDADDKPICMSPLFDKTPSFANALMQNIGGGNTMVFNEAARQLLIAAGDQVKVVVHDWWAYLLITGCGGQVFYDPIPTVRYRQHCSNLVGMSSSWPARLKRIVLMLQGRLREWNDLNVAALQSVHGRLTPRNQEVLNQFMVARQLPLHQRLVGLMRAGVYRQTLYGKLGLIAAAVFNKI